MSYILILISVLILCFISKQLTELYPLLLRKKKEVREWCVLVWLL